MIDPGEVGLQVLIVSRLSLVAETVGAALASRGASVSPVLAGFVTPSVLTRAWQRTRPDVVVILGDLDSIEDVQRVCAWLDAVPGPSIVLTSTPPGSGWGAALRASAREVLPESTGLADLAAVLGEVVEGRQVMGETTRAELMDAWEVVRDERGRLLTRMGLLTARERTVLRLLYAGDTVASIAELFGVSEMTVRSQVGSILTKLGVHSQLGAIALYASMRHGQQPG